MVSLLIGCESVNFQLINRLQSLIDELDAEHFFLVDDDIEWVLLALIILYLLFNYGCIINKCLYLFSKASFFSWCFCRGGNGSDLMDNFEEDAFAGLHLPKCYVIWELWSDLLHNTKYTNICVFKVNSEP